MHYILGILIIAFANKSFTLLPWYHVRGIFNVSDLGILILVISLTLLLIRSRRLGDLFTPIGLFVVAYLLMVLVHVSNASINYDQGVLSGLVRARHQFYYLAYFYFVLVFDTREKIERFLNLLTGVAFLLIVLAVINYFQPVIFHHELYGEGHGERGGVKRAYVAGMDVIGIAFIWQLTNFIYNRNKKFNAGLGAVFLFGGLLFRQTRGRIIAATLVAGWMLIRARRIKILAASFVSVCLIAITLQFILPENVLITSFTSVYSDVSDTEGTWRGRTQQIETSIDTFMEHPLLGSGAVLIRNTDVVLTGEVLAQAYQSDLGWPHWLKNYGLLGVVWMAGLVITLYVKKQRVIKNDGDDIIAIFAWYQWLHFLVGMITIGYFFRAHGIAVISLILAIMTQTLFLGRKENEKMTIQEDKPEQKDTRILQRARASK